MVNPIEPFSVFAESLMPQLINHLRFSVAFGMICLTLCSGCAATQETGSRITPSDTAWIESGQTTRLDIVTEFGTPYMEYPETLPDKKVGRKALYYHTVFMTNRSMKIRRQELFWVRYDPAGVVVDFGIEIDMGH